MSIRENTVVSMHYAVRTPETALDSTYDGEPLVILIGHEQLLPALEAELIGKNVGDKLDVELSPAQAYGEREESLVQEVSLDLFEGMEVQPGMQFRATTDEGEQSVIVLEVEDDAVVIDGNHPLAGQTLIFDVEVLEIREATEEELAHGHAHGPDTQEH